MRITSSAFVHQSSMPAVYTCEGRGINPPLAFSDVPPHAKSMVVIVDDPDAPRGTWVHWVLYNLPANTPGLSENVNALPPGTLVGFNSWQKQNYGAPCPPSGTHRYFFKLFALDMVLDITGATSASLQRAMQGHVLASAELVGLYSKSGS